MIVDRALFRNGLAEEIITLDSITHHEDYLFVKDHLYCITPGCKCRILYIPEGIKSAYFKKWKGDQHHKDCPYFAESIYGAKSRRIAEKAVFRLSDSHVNKILKDTFKRFNETEEERAIRLKKQKLNARIRKNILVAKQALVEPDDITNSAPTTSLNGRDGREGEKKPKVPKRMSILAFRITDIEQTLSTVGLLKSVFISEKLSILTITDLYERLEFKVLLEEAFYENCSTNFNILLEKINFLLSQGERIIVTCIGEVFGENGNFGMRITDDKKITLNDYSLSEYLSRKIL
jgi:hypothetical protein